MFCYRNVGKIYFNTLLDFIKYSVYNVYWKTVKYWNFFQAKCKKYIEPVNCSVTRLHCRLNIFFACTCIYTYVYIYVCDYVTYAIQLWEWAALEYISHNSYFRNSCSIYTAAFLLRRFLGAVACYVWREMCQTSLVCTEEGVDSSVHGL